MQYYYNITFKQLQHKKFNMIKKIQKQMKKILPKFTEMIYTKVVIFRSAILCKTTK